MRVLTQKGHDESWAFIASKKLHVFGVGKIAARLLAIVVNISIYSR